MRGSKCTYDSSVRPTKPLPPAVGIALQDYCKTVAPAGSAAKACLHKARGLLAGEKGAGGRGGRLGPAVCSVSWLRRRSLRGDLLLPSITRGHFIVG